MGKGFHDFCKRFWFFWEWLVASFIDGWKQSLGRNGADPLSDAGVGSLCPFHTGSFENSRINFCSPRRLNRTGVGAEVGCVKRNPFAVSSLHAAKRRRTIIGCLRKLRLLVIAPEHVALLA